MPNLIPGGKNLVGWTAQYGGLNLSPTGSPLGYPEFTLSAPINVAINNRMVSQPFAVIPGGIYSLKGYQDATNLTVNYQGFAISNALTFADIGGFNNPGVIKGYGSANVTIPAGVNSAVVMVYLGNPALIDGLVTWSEPEVELVGFNINLTELPFSPIPFLSYWTIGSNNIPVFSDGNYLYIPFVVASSGSGPYTEYGIIKINSTGWCAFVSSNMQNFKPNGYVGGYGITFDGNKTFTFTNGSFFARFSVPSVFQAGRVFQFPFAGTTPPANACGGTGYFSNIYSASNQTVLEYIEGFPDDAHIWAQVLESRISADLGLVLNGQADPLFNPPLTAAAQTALFPNPPLTYNASGSNISFAPSIKYGGANSIMQYYTATLNASNSGACTANRISIAVATQGLVDCIDIAGGDYVAYAIFGAPGLFMAYSPAQNNFVMTADFSQFYYYASNLPAGYGPIGNGILNGELFTFANNNNGSIHVYSGTVPAFPTANKVVTRQALALINSTRPVSPIGAFKT